MYVCDGCGRNVAGTSKDPIHRPANRKLCTKCLHVPEPRAVPTATRGDAAKARWEAMSDEAKRAHVAKMQAGRVKKKK